MPFNGSKFDSTAAVALPDGRVFSLGEWNAELYDPSTGTFTLTGSEPGSHIADAAVLLRDGRVLAVGGYNDAGFARETEIYDPASGKFTPTGRIKTGRGDETATLLPDGRVLVAGGSDEDQRGGTVFSSAELYDPASGKWSVTGSMSTSRDGSTATLLNDGKVLIAGGQNKYGDFLASAELYDPHTGRFTRTGSMSVSRDLPTATLLSDGRVLIAGGYHEFDPTATAEVYDPSLGTFRRTGDMTFDYGNVALRLADGRVLVIGARSVGDQPSVDLYWP